MTVEEYANELLTNYTVDEIFNSLRSVKQIIIEDEEYSIMKTDSNLDFLDQVEKYIIDKVQYE